MGKMSDDSKHSTQHRELAERLTEARRELREHEQRLAQLKYEWGIAKRLRSQARSEDEREKWSVQSDVCMGLILQQESAIEEIQARIDRHRQEMTELKDRLAGDDNE